MSYEFKMSVFKGRLGGMKPVKTVPFTEEQRVRLNGICNKEIPEGNYVSISTTKHWLISTTGNVMKTTPIILLWDKEAEIVVSIQLPARTGQYFEAGIYYGYARCCIEAFRTATLAPHSGWWNGTGFMACKACSRKSEDEVIEGINSRRLAIHPFPNAHHRTHDDLIHKLEQFCMKKLDMETYMAENAS